MVLFTYLDHLNGTCRVEEIGTEWKPRWSGPDAVMGLCDDSMVGTPKETTVEPDPDAKATLVLTTAAIRLAAERGISPTDAEAMALVMLELDPEGFAKRNPTIYLDIIKNQRAERATKQSEVLSLATATAGQIKAMPTQTMFTHLALAIFAESDDVRDRILAHLGMSVADLRTILDHGDSDSN